MVFLHWELFPDHNNFRKFIMGYYLPKSLAFKKFISCFVVLFAKFRSFRQGGNNVMNLKP